MDHGPHERDAPVPDGPYALFDLDRQQLIAWTADLSTGDVDAVSMSTTAVRSL
jgi:hypothetical protein